MSFSNPLLSSLLSWFVVSSEGPHTLSLSSKIYSITPTLLPLKTPYFSIFPSTSNAPKSYTEGTAMSARDLKLTFTANGRNVEFYSADRYIETMRGVKGDNGKFTYELHVPKPKFPIMAKIMSTPKSRDAGGKLVKEAAVLSSFSLSINVNEVEEAIPSPAARTSSSAAGPSVSSIPPVPPSGPSDISSLVAMAYSTIQSLERRVTALESESTRKDKVIAGLQKGLVELKVQLSNDSSLPPYYAFVYGTLKRGYFNYDKYLGEKAEFGGTSSFITTCKTALPMKLVVGDFGIPYLLDEQDDNSVHVEGEMFEIDAEKRLHLDYLEGVDQVGDWYDRVKIPVIRDDSGEQQMIDAYVSVGSRGRVGLSRGVFSTYTKEIHDAEYVNKDGHPLEEEE
mmetsp:Transcript_16414/g.33797  ORF Transcript_16414/g.33797 Transcript_16414/m.33797 type:complete len:395 (+) Transcript_16414:87-1271(+)